LEGQGFRHLFAKSDILAAPAESWRRFNLAKERSQFFSAVASVSARKQRTLEWHGGHSAGKNEANFRGSPELTWLAAWEAL